MKFLEMIMGENSGIDAAVIKIEEKKASTGKVYSQVTLADGTETIDAKMWADPRVLSFGPKSVIICNIEKQLFNGKDSFILKSAERNEAGNFYDFLPHAPINVEDYWNKTMNYINMISDPDLHTIVDTIFQSNKDKFIYHPAAKGMHHAFISGLLYHTGRMLESANALSTVYDVDKDILLAATALHDIGKLDEMIQDEAGAVSYTMEGELLGHAVIAIEYINDMCNKLGLNRHEEKIRLVEHAIAAHHGQLDWGAITIPHTKESQLLHFIDNIDAKMEMFEENTEKVEPGTIGERFMGLGCGIYRPANR